MANQSDLSLYKPQVSIKEAFEVNEDLPDKELTFDLFKKLVAARKIQDVVFLAIGRMLKIVRDRQLYKILDYEHFEDFLASEELSFSREKAYMYIRIYEHYSEFLQLDEDTMRDFPIARLSLMLPKLKKIVSKEEQIEEMQRMKALRHSDFVVEVKKDAGNDKPTMYYSQEKGKWLIYYWEDKTELINKGLFVEDDQ